MQPIFYQYDFVSLSPSQRLELAQELIASVRTESLAGDFSDADIEAMEHEMAQIRKGNIATMAWATFRKDLRL